MGKDDKGTPFAKIWINPQPDARKIDEHTLLHEMAHLRLQVVCNTSVRCRGGADGARFGREIERLWTLGAYDGLM